MRNTIKYIVLYLSAIVVLFTLAINLAQANQETPEQANEQPLLDEARLQQILAPIALYPDSLLSQVLVAATYPLEVVQAQRWRELHQDLDHEEALERASNKDWAPSVKALVPFTDLLNQMSEDLDWLQELGDAFLDNEAQVLSAVQSLRQQAKSEGHLSNNEYVEVIEEDQGNVIIQPVEKQVVYVPYYDTRYVYGNWYYTNHPPYYWHRPRHYYAHHNHVYWGPRVRISLHGFWGGFHWYKRHTVVYRKPYYYSNRVRVRNHEYSRWQHNSKHRRNVKYRHVGTQNRYAVSRSYQPNLAWRGNRSASMQYPKAEAGNRVLKGQRLTKSREKVKQSTYHAQKVKTQTVRHPKVKTQKVQRYREQQVQTSQPRINTHKVKSHRSSKSTKQYSNSNRVKTNTHYKKSHQSTSYQRSKHTGQKSRPKTHRANKKLHKAH